jgi:hypothetical protein
MLDHQRTELISLQGGFCVNTVKMGLFLFRSWKCMGHEGVDPVLLIWVVAETQGHAPAALTPKIFVFCWIRDCVDPTAMLEVLRRGKLGFVGFSAHRRIQRAGLCLYTGGLRIAVHCNNLMISINAFCWHCAVLLFLANTPRS